MIEIVVSNNSCPHCDIQKRIMEKSFFADEYRLIEHGSAEFNEYDMKEKVDAVPFIVVRQDDGAVKYASKGKLDGISLRQIERLGQVIATDQTQPLEKSFNLHHVRQFKSDGRLSKHMDA